MKLLSIIIILGIFFISCDNKPTAVISGENTGLGTDLLALPSLSGGGYQGQFILRQGSSKISYENFQDSVLQDLVIEKPLGVISQAFFTSPSLVTNTTVNGSSYETNNYGGRYTYSVIGSAIDLHGGNNTFTWDEGGKLRTHNVSYNAPPIAINSPAFMSVNSKSSGLTITWTPSKSTNDYVKISLSGQDTVSWNTPPGRGTISTFDELTYDNGSFTIPASILNTFVQNKASLRLTRGIVDEATINSKKYLFVIATDRKIEIKLQ